MFPFRLIVLSGRKLGSNVRIAYHTSRTTSMPTPKASSIIMRGAAIGVAIGVVYSVYSHYNLKHSMAKPKASDSLKPKLIKEIPGLRVTKKIQNLGMETELNLVLFQYQSCPFCSKVRAFLNANGMTYTIVEVGAITKSEVKWSQIKKVPMVLVKTRNGYMQLSDSSAIISILSSYLKDKTQNFEEIVNYYPIISYMDGNGNKKEEILNKYFLMFTEKKSAPKEEIQKEHKWRQWSDEVLLHTICPNIYRTIDESSRTLNFFAEVGEWKDIFGTTQNWLMINGGTYAMWALGKMLKLKYKYGDDVRQPLYDACNQWSKEITSSSGPFMGGSNPDLSDLAVYGLLTCIEGSQAFQDVMNNTNIRTWFNSVTEFIRHKNLQIK